MADDLEDLLREHYRRAAEDVRPDVELLTRYRNAVRPARSAPAWPRILFAAAAVAAVALLTWGFLRGIGRDVPATPPPASGTSPSPAARPPSPRESTPRPPAPPTARPVTSATSPAKRSARPQAGPPGTPTPR